MDTVGTFEMAKALSKVRCTFIELFLEIYFFTSIAVSNLIDGIFSGRLFDQHSIVFKIVIAIFI